MKNLSSFKLISLLLVICQPFTYLELRGLTVLSSKKSRDYVKPMKENKMGYPHFSVDCNEYHHLEVDFDISQEGDMRPKIICLCGSTRFKEAFDEANYKFTMGGAIVLSVGFFHHSMEHGGGVGCTKEQKEALDVLHKRKIDLADEVFVLNVGDYIGDSTRSEIEYAVAHKKPVTFLESTRFYI
jgi:hypothetical protein